MTQWGLDTLFNPAKRHMDEEKRRLQSTREEAGDSSGGKRIDLESGKVTIRRADSDDVDDTNPTETPSARPETSAARRARLRRRPPTPEAAPESAAAESEPGTASETPDTSASD
jgi:hypothetical protein